MPGFFKTSLCGFLLILAGVYAYAQLPPVFQGENYHIQQDQTVRKYLSPVKILWQTDSASTIVKDAATLLSMGNGQAELSGGKQCLLQAKTEMPGILLDFGREIHGGVQLVTGKWDGSKPIKLRIRFGESASEAMSDIGNKGATNDHAMRDMIVEVPWLGKLEIGNTGFRFVRIDLLDKNAKLLLKEARAVFIYRDIAYKGSFESSDERLNKIWMTGAYTVHLNMQDYLWDGIKRDRLVWVGDMNPEVATINAVFGYNEVVPKSLDLARDNTPLPGWMNGISTYSMWWIITQYEWYLHNGDMAYLKQQQNYLRGLVKQIIAKVDADGKEHMGGTRFLDWPSSTNTQGINAGIQAMTVWSLTTASSISHILGDAETENLCKETVTRMKKYVPDANKSKQAAALMAIAKLIPAEKADKEVIGVDGAKNFSTFFGYYMLIAMARAGDFEASTAIIKNYWGAMLDMGATTFWEDFNLDWLPNASRIDALVPEGKKDIHGDYGAYCYKGFRHSLCHGWASGPTAWLTQYVLGVNIVEAGCKRIRIEPHLGTLKFVKGTYPTPYGIVTIKHTRAANGTIKTVAYGPKQVNIEIVKDKGKA